MRKQKQKQKKVVRIISDPDEVARMLEERDRRLIERDRKRARTEMDKVKQKEKPPYRVLFPGCRDDRIYKLRQPKDPRLGTAQRRLDAFFQSHHSARDGETEGDSETESDGESGNDVPTVIETVSFAELFSSVSKFDKIEVVDQRKLLKKRVKNEAQQLKQQDCICAEEAIKFYNTKHGTCYEILETLGSYDTYDAGFWYHCNFKATDPTYPSSPVLFFAELFRPGTNEIVVLCCQILEDGQRDRIVRGCELCGDLLWHPVNGFEKGKIEDTSASVLGNISPWSHIGTTPSFLLMSLITMRLLVSWCNLG